MIIKTNKGTFKVYFRHQNNTNNVDKFGIRNSYKKEQSFTSCIVKDVDLDSEIVTGIAYLSPKDKNFNKEKGRRISLKRALLSFSILDKKDRELIWNEYFSRFDK